jgi:peptide/nickel transport system substrate-binding protein
LFATTAMLFAACAPAASIPAAQSGTQPAPSATPKRIVVSVQAEPAVIIPKLSRVLPGSEAMEVLVNSGMTIVSPIGLSPLVAEAVPTVENGLWKLLPDGRMETTWKIRPNAAWHDGTPFTAQDLAFTATVGTDIPFFRHAAYVALTSVEVVDPHTALVHWDRPNILADAVFSSSLDKAVYTAPLPRHLLEQPYLTEKTSFDQLPYWTNQFVGTGPFRLREWVQGSHMLLEANDQYVLGRPKIDSLDVRFLGEANAVVTNVLAGAVDVTLGRGLAIDQALEIQAQKPDADVKIGKFNWVTIYPQFQGPSPSVILDLNFRRALMHALDREEMVTSIQKGLVPVAHAYIGPTDPYYKDIESSIVKYEFDPRKSVQLLESLGYRRSGDGPFRDPTGQTLSIEVRTTAENSIHKVTLPVVTDFWQQVGVDAQPAFTPIQLQTDRKYRATYPGFEMIQHPNQVLAISDFHSRETALPENNYTRSGNNGGYMNSELDALVDRFFQTIPQRDRTQILGQIMHHITENLTQMGLFYQMEPNIVSKRLINVEAKTSGSTPVWNVQDWDLRN